MILILMRHGDAEVYDPDRSDSERQLTEKGQLKVHNMVKLAHVLWPDNGVLWSSSLIRAKQTAGILQKELAIKPVKYSSMIETGDLAAVAKTILCDNTQTPVVIVGHEPFLGRWLYQLTGATIEFKKAAFAVIDYLPVTDEIGEGTLLAYVQPKLEKLLNQEAIRL